MRWSIVLLVLAISPSAFGDLPYGRQELTFGNWKVWAQLGIAGITADGQHITGSNVTAIGTAGAVIVSGAPSYSFMQVKEAKLEVTGANDDGPVSYSQTFTYPDTHPTGGLQVSDEAVRHGPWADFQGIGGVNGLLEGNPPDIRFTAAKFTHDTSVTIKLTIRVKGYRLDDGVWVAEMSGPLTTTIVPKAYNYFLNWRTTKMADGSTWPSGLQSEINHALNYIGNYFLAESNYQGGSHPLNTNHYLKADILDETQLAVGVVAMTHGFSSGMCDSEGYQSTGAHFLTWSEIEDAVNDRPSGSTVPPNYNAVILYSCNTCSVHDPATTYGSIAPARAAAGFDGYVWTHGKEVTASGTYGAIVPLGNHSNLLKQKLHQGYTLSKAIQEVHKSVMAGEFEYVNGVPDPESFFARPLTVTSASDGETTIEYVYLNAVERAAHPSTVGGKNTSWYFVIGAPPPA